VVKIDKKNETGVMDQRTQIRDMTTTHHLRQWSSHTAINKRRGSLLKLDRKYQLELLEMLAQSYPQCFDIRPHLQTLDESEDKRYEANMVYLHEHGLIESGIRFGAGGDSYASSLPRITNKGMDFLADDGGLSAILGVVTIKLHDETIRHLVSRKIDESDLSQADKKKWKDRLQELSGECIKRLTMQLLDKGVSHIPDVIELIGKSLN
jgi:hypothetical protein